MDGPSHIITVTVRGNYPHGSAEHAQVSVAGDGDVAHFLHAFQAALIAGGFSADTAGSLSIREP
jgi:hypothetical protein